MFPNKVVDIENSILYKMTYILKNFEVGDTISSLYLKVSNKFLDINEFLFSIDILFVLDFIDHFDEFGGIINVRRNNL